VWAGQRQTENLPSFRLRRKNGGWIFGEGFFFGGEAFDLGKGTSRLSQSSALELAQCLMKFSSEGRLARRTRNRRHSIKNTQKLKILYCSPTNDI